MKEIEVDINGILHTIQVDEDDPRETPAEVGTSDAKKSETPANKSKAPEKK